MIKVIARLPESGARTVNNRHMPDVNIQYILAAIIVEGQLTFEAAHDYQRFGNPRVLARKEKVQLIGDEEMEVGVPITYVPARNTIFLSFALAWAEVLGANDVFLGVNALDYSGYPDCRPEYIEAFEKLANLATKAGVEGRTRVRIHTPLIQLSKAEIVKLGRELGVQFGLTHSCYDPQPDGTPCGQCDSCLLRRKGFQEAGIEDR